jgi:DGQHR domain-containing protein
VWRLARVRDLPEYKDRPTYSGEEMAKAKANMRLSLSAVLITQGNHKFYTCTMDSDVLASNAFVVSRSEDPKEGFQRYLNKSRAMEIAEYIDTGFGTVPSSIVLSAQEDAEFEYDSKAKTINFLPSKYSFLILDGQHRVYGFSLAKSKLRVPVVIYDGLSLLEEVKIFIDLNTKQKPVPNELLLDIKKLANDEKEDEKFINDLFDLFHSEKNSVFRGLTSPATKELGKISRVNLKSSFTPIYPRVKHIEILKVYAMVNTYLTAVDHIASEKGVKTAITNPTILGGVMMLFPEVLEKAKDRFRTNPQQSHFVEILEPAFTGITSTNLRKPGTGKREFYARLAEGLKQNIQLDF